MMLHDTNQDCMLITYNYHEFDMILCHRGPFGQGKTKPHMFIMTHLTCTCLSCQPQSFWPNISKTRSSLDLCFTHDIPLMKVSIQFKVQVLTRPRSP